MTENNNIKSLKKEKLYAIIFFSAGLLYLLIGSNYGLNIYDEAIGLYGAESVMNGKLPYLDFWTMYAPGQYYLLGSVSELFSWHVMTGRILSILFTFGSSILIYSLSRRILKNLASIMPAAVFIAWAGSNPFYSRAIPTAIFLSLFTLVYLIRFIDTGNKRRIVYAGILTGITAIFRHDIGFYLALSCFIMIAVYSIKENKTSLIRTIAIYAASIFIVAGPVAVYFLANIPFEMIYNQLIEVPSGIFREYRALPFPIPFAPHNYTGRQPGIMKILISGWEGLIFYLPLIIYLISIMQLAKERRASGNNQFYIRLAIAIVGLLFYTQALVRSETEHLVPTMIFAAILLFDLFKSKKQRLLIGIAFVFLVCVPVLKKAKDMKSLYSGSTATIENVSRANGIHADKEWIEDYQRTITAVQNDTDLEEKIFIANNRHDKIIVNDIMLYFLCERQAATKYYELHPGIATTEEVQELIISDIVKSNVKTIVAVDNGDVYEPNKSAESSGIFLLDDFIKSNFNKSAAFGSYTILKVQY